MSTAAGGMSRFRVLPGVLHRVCTASGAGAHLWWGVRYTLFRQWYGPLAQLVELRTFNPQVVGSSPTGPTVSECRSEGLSGSPGRPSPVCSGPRRLSVMRKSRADSEGRFGGAWKQFPSERTVIHVCFETHDGNPQHVAGEGCESGTRSDSRESGRPPSGVEIPQWPQKTDRYRCYPRGHFQPRRNADGAPMERPTTRGTTRARPQ
jgi:hypothetical protein